MAADADLLNEQVFGLLFKVLPAPYNCREDMVRKGLVEIQDRRLVTGMREVLRTGHGSADGAHLANVLARLCQQTATMQIGWRSGWNQRAPLARDQRRAGVGTLLPFSRDPSHEPDQSSRYPYTGVQKQRIR